MRRLLLALGLGILAVGSTAHAASKAATDGRKLARIARDGVPRLTSEHTFTLGGSAAEENGLGRVSGPWAMTPGRWRPVRGTVTLKPGVGGGAPTAVIDLPNTGVRSQEVTLTDLGTSPANMRVAVLASEREMYPWTGARYFDLGGRSWLAITSQGIELSHSARGYMGLPSTVRAVLQPVDGPTPW